jgi:DNA replication initiation complex subunit (GINS family)
MNHDEAKRRLETLQDILAREQSSPARCLQPIAPDLVSETIAWAREQAKSINVDLTEDRDAFGVLQRLKNTAEDLSTERAKKLIDLARAATSAGDDTPPENMLPDEATMYGMSIQAIRQVIPAGRGAR